MHRISARGLEAQLHLQLILPLPLRLVVVVSLQRQTAHCRVVTLTALVPVARYVVLHKLKESVTLACPELRFLHNHLHRVGLGSFRHGLCLLHHRSSLLHGLVNDVLTQFASLLLLRLGDFHQVRAVQIDVHQGPIDGLGNLIVGLR